MHGNRMSDGDRTAVVGTQCVLLDGSVVSIVVASNGLDTPVVI